jgi:hypothetical protein
MAKKDTQAILESELSKCVSELAVLRSSALPPGYVPKAKPVTVKQIMASVMDLFEDNVQNIDDLKRLIISSLSYSPVHTRNREKMSRLLHDLTEQILDWSATAIVRVNTDSGYSLAACPDALHLYGLYMIVVKHYTQMRGLRARVREDMATFVEFYNKTNEVDLQDLAGTHYIRFFEYHATVLSPNDKNHTDSMKLYLSEMGGDIMRRMLIMGTHLVELVVAWDQIEQLEMLRGSVPSADAGPQGGRGYTA